ncbi:MAG: C40 family peptidase [Burkholderiales bacterium]|nr:C40 family peptidase [Burkholderiales bacterium]
MRVTALLGAALAASALALAPAIADERAVPVTELPGDGARELKGMEKLVSDALALVGIRYRRGGESAESGFDCSGFVGYVFRETMGLVLPRTSREISRTGEAVERNELEPGDLVFFNTMRQAFSHVGIYLGNDQFVHAPRSGRAIRVEDMSSRYWARRYNGARRIEKR